MNDSFGVILATLVIAASAITARQYWHQPELPISHELSNEEGLRNGTYHYEPRREPRRTHLRCREVEPLHTIDEPLHMVDELPVDYSGPPSCVGRKQDDHCFREMYRAQLEALEANTWYDELQAVSPTGAAFAKPTLVRSSLGNI